MSIDLYITFIIVSAVIIIIPGPNVLVIVSTSLSQGVKNGLLTVCGTSTAMLFQLCAVAMGTALFVESLTTGFEYLRWLGVAYLLYIGMKHLLCAMSNSRERINDISMSRPAVRGFFISLVNPKTMLFFAAFLPQFILDGDSYTEQYILLSITFVVLATLLDSLYAILAGKAWLLFEKCDLYKIRHGVSGVLFMGSGAWLALMRRV